MLAHPTPTTVLDLTDADERKVAPDIPMGLSPSHTDAANLAIPEGCSSFL
jgi:hypothetical protein